MPYNSQAIKDKARLVVKDSLGNIPTFVACDTLSTAELDAMDQVEIDAGYPSDIIGRNRTFRDTPSFTAFNENFVRTSSVDPFRFMGVNSKDFVGLPWLYSLNFNLLQFRDERYPEQFGNYPFFTSSNGNALPLPVNYFEEVLEENGLSFRHEGFVNENDVQSGNPSNIRDGLYDGTNNVAQLHHVNVPASETWLYVPASTGVNGQAGFAIYKTSRTGAFAGVVAVALGVSYSGSSMSNTLYVDTLDQELHLKIAGVVLESAWKPFVDNPASVKYRWLEVDESTINIGELPAEIGNTFEGNPISGGYRRLGIRMVTGPVMGAPVPSVAVTLEGAVTVTSTTAGHKLTVGSGPRSVEWRGADLATTQGTNSTDTDIPLTNADYDELGRAAVRSYSLHKVMNIGTGLVEKTQTAQTAKKGDIDLGGEIFQEADPDKDRPQLTFAEAEARCVGQKISAWHAVDMVVPEGVNPGVITIAGTAEALTLEVQDASGTIYYTGLASDIPQAEYTSLIEGYLAGSTVIDNTGLGQTKERQLADALGLTTAQLLTYDSIPDGKKNEFNETRVFEDLHNPFDLDESTLAAQQLMQCTNNRLSMGRFVNSMVSYARFTSKSLKLNSI